MGRLIYLDNAATSFPKPPGVVEAMTRFMTEIGANPGRGGHRLAREAERIVWQTRESLSRLFHIPDPERVVFTLNVTEAINAVIHGFLKEGDHVITTAMDHNAVLRPLEYLRKRGAISVDVAPCDRQGFLDLDALKRLIQRRTTLVIVNHASNVCGTIQDIRAVREMIGDIPLLVDTAQTAGGFPIDVAEDGIDCLAFTGHKGLLGPQGTGGLYIRKGLDVRPLVRGGTGSHSESLDQPGDFPDLMESGTRNNVGIAGLGAGVDYILERGVEAIMCHERELTAKLLRALRPLPGVTVYGPLDAMKQTATLSITFDSVLPDGEDQALGGCGAINLSWTEEGVSPNEAETFLSQRYDILVRVGLHCAPLAHKTLGTFPEGTIRLSLGAFNTQDDVDAVVRAIRDITKGKGS